MRQPFFTRQFKKDLKKVKKSNKDTGLIKFAMNELIEENTLDDFYKDHLLIGNWSGCRECHIQNDWLLIYKLVDEDKIYFERTGTHSELFG